ncbi:MAG TPA: zeta toxin family protein [Rickettsiales bacterium]|nr:zeta toxin family protein [Rickettsiales bacterium]
MEKNLKNELNKSELYASYKDNTDVFLTNEQIYKIFEKFWEENCSKLKSEDNPKLFIIAAQPGSGKTGLVSRIESQHKIPILTGDNYRIYHPNYKMFFDTQNFSKFTHPLNLTMCRLSIARCLDRHISFIMENPLKNPLQNAEYIVNGNNLEFKVNFYIMAVKKNDSFLGTYYRLAKFIEVGTGARETTHKTHDECYDGISKSLELKESISKLNSLKLFNRNLEPIFEANISSSNVNTICLEAKKSLIAERNRPYTKEEVEELEKQKNFVLDYIDKGLITVISKDDFLKEYESRKEKKSNDKLY